MKLRTRLTLGTMAVLLTALLLCCAFVVTASRQTLLSEAQDYTIEELDRCNRKMIPYFYQNTGTEALVRRSMLEYGIATGSRTAGTDCAYVLQTPEGDDIYNNSGINAAEALKKVQESKNLRCTTVSLGGKDYCLAGMLAEPEDASYLLAVVRDITDQMNQVRSLTLRCAGICMTAAALAAAVTALFLTRTLRPMKQLERSAEAVMKGDYYRRMELKRKDELGTLARSFDRMSEAVAEQFRAVEASAKERELLLSALTHEMRTPVTAITGYAYALKAVRLSEAQTAEAIDFIESESLRLARLDEKLSQLISLEKKPVELKTIQSGALRENLERILAPQAKAHGMKLTFQFDHEALQGDSDLLLMLVSNLFDNARKAGAAEIVIQWQGYVLSVADNGPGIPADQLQLIMQPFYQMDASRNQEGFGLGLALCQKIARLHGGTLEAESTLGQGSVFKVRFYNSFTTP